ncbi:MAG: BON domain-containing protein [Alphaproteobacteria bacterium]|nr:BON domain-containing protein [Alphaproteobacteria bacterium]MBV9862501.1 BON domain-containing protein [Alphaproteobacteria bacterium]
MGEYEDRYPEAYGRGEENPSPTDEGQQALGPPRQVRDTPLDRETLEREVIARREAERREAASHERGLFGLWRHGRADQTRANPPPAGAAPTPAISAAPPPTYAAPTYAALTYAAPAYGAPVHAAPAHTAPAYAAPAQAQRRAEGPYRGVGPRNYRRSAERIRDDLCDRLTEDPFLDASDIDVSVNGTEVTLKGTVEDRAAYRQAQSIAEDVAGVTQVYVNLRVRNPGAARGTSPGSQVNAAMGTTPTRRS